MNLSIKWINDFVKLEMPIQEFVDGMTMSGSKVESFEVMGEKISNIVVGKVVEIHKHEDSDRLWICSLDVGKGETIQIVTAAQNVYAGAIVPVALHKSTLADGTKITKGKLRGEISNGMLCSFAELGMEQEDFPYAKADGILVLNDDPNIDSISIGMDIRKAVGLDDTSVEFEITNNRPDCLSVIGLAREAAATFDIPMNYSTPSYNGIAGSAKDIIDVSVENTQLCTRYMAAVVKNVKIAPSPKWLAERLRASGIRPINNFVDITNYVMLEYGHPMHAFDLRYVQDEKIIIRNAKSGEKIKILDGDIIELSPEMLVIADGEKPMAVAGVMGGENSGIMEDTTTVVFESAHFNGGSVRLTAKKINKRTDASSRFEKNIDPINAEFAMLRALQLVEQLGCGEVVKEIIDANYIDKPQGKIKHDYRWINKFLGIEISEQRQISILKSLNFGYEDGYAIVPNTRIDMENSYDLAEEIARIYGYNLIPSTTPRLASNSKITKEQRVKRQLVNLLVGSGCYEVETFSFISPKAYEKILLPVEKHTSVVIENPLGEDTSVMRNTMIPSMLGVIGKNLSNRTMSGRFFEIGREFYPNSDGLPTEVDVLSVGIYGEGEDFYSLKGIVEEVLELLSIKGKFVPQQGNPTFHPGRCADVVVDDNRISTMGEIHPIVAENFGISSRVYMATIPINSLVANTEEERIYKALPKFPAMTRDLSLVCDEGINSGDIIDIITDNASNLEQINLFDVYRGEQVEKGKKSLSYKLVFRKLDSTMTDGEADEIVEVILSSLKSRDIILRA